MSLESIYKVLLIMDSFETAHSLQKSYDNNRREDLEFEQSYRVYLKVSLMKGVMRFDKMKLIPWYVGPYEVF